MPAYYLESSAAIKAYDAEAGSRWMVDLINGLETEALLLGHLAVVEITSGLRRKRAAIDGAHLSEGVRRARNGELRAATARFQADVVRPRYTLVSVTAGIIQSAAALADEHALRGYDAVHLATVRMLADNNRELNRASVELVSADRELLAAAAEEGLVCWNPNEQE